MAHDFNNMLGVILSRVELAFMKLEPTLFMSGYMAEIIVAANESDSRINFLGKPFRVAELAEKVRRVLAESAQP